MKTGRWQQWKLFVFHVILSNIVLLNAEEEVQPPIQRPDEQMMKKFRVRAGTRTEITSFPMMIVIQGTKAYCSGSLLDAFTVLTAAHCFCVKDNTMQYVYASQTSRNDLGAKVSIEKFFINEKYNDNCELMKMTGVGMPSTYDTALVKTKVPIPETMGTKYVKLSSTSVQSVGSTRLTFAGYGRDITDGSRYTLKYGESPPSSCGVNGDEFDGALCLDSDANVQAPDSGDSGGPVLVKEGEWKQIAVVSGVMPISATARRIVLADVARNREFIQKNMGGKNFWEGAALFLSKEGQDVNKKLTEKNIGYFFKRLPKIFG